MDPRRETSGKAPWGGVPSREGTPPQGRGGILRGSRRHPFSVEEKRALLAAYEASGQTMREFCAEHSLSTATLATWRRRRRKQGPSGLEPRPNPRNRKGGHRGAYTPEERRQAVEAFLGSGVSRTRFALLWGVTVETLSRWIRCYEEQGPRGLEDRFLGAGKGKRPSRKQIPPAVRAEIVRTKHRFPSFGLRKVRDFLLRFQGVKVSAGTVRNTLREAGVSPPAPVRKRRRRKPMPPRRFERARPGELWQSDITSFLLHRHSQRVYLTVFLDDCSRYIVSWGLQLHQRQELVMEALMEGMARFGKPREVLTDQGRQYVTWRGKAAFQKLLEREGIRHVISRTHHPQTLGKTERFWATVNREFWERVRPEDLGEARERLGHFIAHYNHFRTHQGIGGLVPADRFFGAETALRRTLEAEMKGNELSLALEETPRRPVFLFGRIGDEQVSLHGEKGRLVVQTPEGGRQEMDFEALGMGGREAARSDEGGRDGNGGNGGELVQRAETEAHAETVALPGAGSSGGAGAGPLGAGERGGAEAGASSWDGCAGVLGGTQEQGGACGGTGGAAGAGVAAFPAGLERYALRASSTTQEAQDDAIPPSGGRGSEGSAEEDSGTGAGEPGAAQPGGGDEGTSFGAGGSSQEEGDEAGREAAEKKEREGATEERSEAGWEPFSGSGEGFPGEGGA